MSAGRPLPTAVLGDIVFAIVALPDGFIDVAINYDRTNAPDVADALRKIATELSALPPEIDDTVDVMIDMRGRS